MSSTAAATFRQAVALIFDHVVSAESLPAGRFGSGGYVSRTNSVTSDVNRNIKRLEYVLTLFIVSYYHKIWLILSNIILQWPLTMCLWSTFFFVFSLGVFGGIMLLYVHWNAAVHGLLIMYKQVAGITS